MLAPAGTDWKSERSRRGRSGRQTITSHQRSTRHTDASPLLSGMNPTSLPNGQAEQCFQRLFAHGDSIRRPRSGGDPCIRVLPTMDSRLRGNDRFSLIHVYFWCSWCISATESGLRIGRAMLSTHLCTWRLNRPRPASNCTTPSVSVPSPEIDKSISTSPRGRGDAALAATSMFPTAVGWC